MSKSSIASCRAAYTLTFPSEFDEEQVAAWLRALSGTLRPSVLSLAESPTIVFELWASGDGITHRLKVPKYTARYAVELLRISRTGNLRLIHAASCPFRR